MNTTTRPQTDARALDALARRAPATLDPCGLAEWLRHHGPAHLSAIERIELAERLITRRRFLIGAGALVLAGCGSTAPASGPPSAASSAAPSLVALDEFAGLSVLSLGVRPAMVFLTFGYASARAVFDFAGVPTAPAAPDGVNLEAVAALDPAIILGVSIPTTAAAQDTLNVIAPTTVIEYTASWQDQLKSAGAAIGRSEAAAARTGRLEGALAALKGDLAGAAQAGRTVSVIGTVAGDMFALSRTGSVGSILEQVGLRRPAAQDVATEPTNPFITISAERLNDHDAETIVLLSGGAYSPDALTASALWPTLDAVRANQVVRVVAELWFSSNAFGVDWIVRDLRAALLGDGAVAGEADVVSRWQAFAAL